MNDLKMAVMASHGGTNFQSIAEACKSGRIEGQVNLLVCNNTQAKVLDRAEKLGVPTFVCPSKNFGSFEDWDQQVTSMIEASKVDIVVLAGFMKKLGPCLLRTYKGRILNIHPSLLPKFGGKGMYGMNVHEAVVASGDSETGMTLHIVSEEYDEGPVVAQRRFTIREDDSAESLSERMRPEENHFYVETLAKLSRGELSLSQY